jgi:hypothetical protein
METWAYFVQMKNSIMLCQSYILESQVEGNQHNQINACHRSTVHFILHDAYSKIFKSAISVCENKITLYFLKIVDKLFILFGNRSKVIYTLCLQTP